MSAESPTPNREIAYRLFAAEYDDSTLSHAESDEERAPNYVITPTGARLNRLFIVGTLTEISAVNDEMLRARVVDPTGAFVVYAGQYQPDELAALEQLEPPEFVAITGKARTFQPDDSDQVYTSIRPESIAAVDAETRDRWVVSAAEQTIDRIATYARAADVDAYDTELRDALVEAGVHEPLAKGITLAQDHYGTTPTYLEALYERALETAEVIAGDRETVDEFTVRPNETTPDSQSFEEITADCAVEVDAAEIRAAIPDTATEEADEPLESETAVASTAPSGGSESDELLGSAEESETPETDVSAELSSSADSDSVEPTDSVQMDADIESDADTQPTAEAASNSTDESGVESTDERSSDSDENSSPESDEMASDDTAAVDSGTETSEAIESDDDSEDEDLGDFDSEGFDDGMYEMDDEEREELEDEFGAEFSTGAEVDDPGSADIDVPDGDEEDPKASTEDAVGSSSNEAATEEPEAAATDLEEIDDTEADDAETDPDATDGAETEQESDFESDGDVDEEVDIQAQVMETMNRLDDGDGADRATVVSNVVDETGADPDDVEDAIQEALMGGQCYEPDDETLKAI